MAAQHHPGEDRQHRQYAGREGQCQTAEEEQCQFLPVPVGRDWRCIAAAGSRHITDLDELGLRRIAQALVGAALVADLQAQRALVRIVQRQADVQHAVVHLDIAEEFVVLGLAGGQLGLAEDQIGRLDAEVEAVAVEVVTLGGDEAQGHRLGIAADQAQLEGFAYGQEIAAVVQRCTNRRRGRALVEQIGAGGQAQAEQKQGKQ